MIGKFLLLHLLVFYLLPVSNTWCGSEEEGPTEAFSLTQLKERPPPPASEPSPIPEQKRQPTKLLYTYKDRDHTYQENLGHLTALYGLSWMTYYLTQADTFNNHGSWRNYRNNFGQFVLDKDEPYWNWISHPYIGSQMYLYYRANGYSRFQSIHMTFWQSALFEMSVEIYTEPASIEDLYQTPVLGATLGFLFEHAGLFLLNQDYLLGKILGHMINPFTLFWFYEGKVRVRPNLSLKRPGFNLYVDF